MESCFLTRPGQRLFAVYHPPTRPARSSAVLLCAPIGREQHRAARAWSTLAQRLAATGVAALRYDPTGCGDSAGDWRDWSLARWSEDAHAAAEELRGASAAEHLILLGLGVGAVVASRAASACDARGVVAWNPIADGAARIAQWLAEDRRWRRDHGLPAARRSPDGSCELLGFRHPAALMREIRDLPSRSAPTVPHLLIENDGSGAAAVLARSAPTQSRTLLLPADPRWTGVGDLFQATPLPERIFDATADFIAEVGG
jgi:alpha-beta hydrolase superfamily lysophospholipase